MLAVATPCCPDPVSVTTRPFPIRFASSACPTALLIAWEPVCASSSLLIQILGKGEWLVVVARREHKAGAQHEQEVTLVLKGRARFDLSKRGVQL